MNRLSPSAPGDRLVHPRVRGDEPAAESGAQEYPRVRGDEPVRGLHFETQDLCSPRPRG